MDEFIQLPSRGQIFAGFAALRNDIKWNVVSQLPGLHEGKSTLLTGGAAGLGKDILWWTAVFGGGKVVFCDVNADAGKAVETDFNAQIARLHGSGQVTFRQLDVSNSQACADVVAETIRLHGKLDILINNAGIGTADTLASANLETFARIMAVNLGGLVHLGQPFIRHVAEGRQSGSIAPEERKKLIAVCSIGGMTSLAERFSYGVSKFAEAGAIGSTIVDHGDIVEVIGINPGRIATDMVKERLAQKSDDVRELEAWKMASTQRTGEMLKPEEIAGFISFAASDDPATFPLRNTQVSMDDGWTLGHQPRIQDLPAHLLQAMLK